MEWLVLFEPIAEWPRFQSLAITLNEQAQFWPTADQNLKRRRVVSEHDAPRTRSLSLPSRMTASAAF
jgi:hypothetical protein